MSGFRGRQETEDAYVEHAQAVCPLRPVHG